MATRTEAADRATLAQTLALDRRRWPEDANGVYQATLDALPAHVAVLDERGFILVVNKAWVAFGAEKGNTPTGVGTDYLELCRGAAAANPGSEAALVAEGLERMLAGTRDELVIDYPFHGEDLRWFVMRAAPFSGPGPSRIVLQHQDVTPQRMAEAEARFRSRLLDSVDAAVVAVDPDGTVIEWSRGAEDLYGWTRAEALGRPAMALVASEPGDLPGRDPGSRLGEDGHWEGEVKVRGKDGSPFSAYVRLAGLEDPSDRLGTVGVALDISERLRSERDLRSARDYLRAVADTMGDGLCTFDEEGRVIYMNAQAEIALGWSQDDLVGQDVHEVLHHTRPDGSPLLPEDCPLVAARRAQRPARLADDVLVRRDGTLLPVQLSQTPFETEDAGCGFVLVFSDISERKRQERSAEERLRDLAGIERIRDALDHDHLELYAQPIIEIEGGNVVQHELLIRMLGEDGTVIAPGEFLPLAEAYGLIGEIDRWVVHEGIGLAAAGYSVHLNVSAHSVCDRTFSDYLMAELSRSGADPGRLVFELTETALVRDEAAALDFVTTIGARGCGLALDDFGTGYVGFGYLKRLPVDFLKIDIEFVRDLVSEPASRKVVEAVVTLARDFGTRTVAEGVEDTATLTLLQELGVDYAQGFRIARPMPLEESLQRKGGAHGG